ncbi:prepilin-type N-terminal cleavage/methylation domain-containing protein [Diaphorobacter sp.]|jgi:general secretion pathway protein J|uniref:prepilin-type N-terminal cleavage/methylation domain-containing protein n=1 Tax=Diaphorobacter sp. TaxID=1934310 RepID=UPI0025848BB6|nr:prepilin-type N-terminal cleavage/methylation domain-containing protein [Diaphorobacter sp.]
MKRPSRTQGFTLLELLIGMTLLGFILALLFAGLNLGTRSWEAGEQRIATSSRQAVVVDFIRRTLEQAYPLRWRVEDEERLAFAGEAESLRFVGPVPMHGGAAVNQVLILDLAEGETGRNLVMRWQLPDLREPGFEPAAAAEPKILIKGIERLTFSYYGTESDAEAPAWHERWVEQKTPPELIRLQLVMENGEPWPDIVAAPRVRPE